MEFGHLENQETDGSGTVNGDCVPRLEVGESDGMYGNTQGLEHRTRGIVDFVRKDETGLCRNNHPFTESSVIRELTAKTKVETEIGMPRLTHLALPARLGRINRDVEPGIQSLACPGINGSLRIPLIGWGSRYE
jgi:hypothetical protein